MGSFSFGSGNAAQLLRIPLHLVGRAVTFVVPRRSDRWVFGCAVGIADGALALWEHAQAEGATGVWLVTRPAHAAEASARGIPSVPASSLRGFWLTARAGIVVVTHGLGDVNRYATPGAFVVQLWHGIPLKRIGLDSPVTTRPPLPIPGLRRLIEIAYRRTQRRIRLLPAASHLVRGRLETAFGLDESRIPVTGEPRVDVLSCGTAEGRREAARKRLGALIGPVGEDTRLILYAPTWRDGDPDPGVPSPDQWRALVAMLEAQDAVLLIRSHPLGRGEYRPPVPTDRVRALGGDLVADVTPLLPGLDVLITDYSSLIYDSALVPVPVVFLAPDLPAYTATRGFYGRYRDVAGAAVAADWDAASAQLEAVLGDETERERRIARARALSERVHAFRDGRNTERVYQAIVRRRRRAGRRRRGAE